MSKKIISLVEYDYLHHNNYNDEKYLTPNEFKTIKEFVYENEKINKTQFLKPTTINGKEVLQAQQFVGIIQLKNGKTIEILPKICNTKDIEETKKILIKMLKTLKKFPFKNFQFGNLKTVKMSVFEIFIQMFLVELWQVVKKGIKHNYITIEENANFLKGKLLFSKHIKSNLVHKERFFISHDKYLPDRVENRIIKTTLLFLYKISNETSNKKMIRSLLFIFDPIPPITKNLKHAFSKINLDRTVNYYQTVLMWCRIFLLRENFSPYTGKNIAFALLFDMNHLFENFVGKYIKDNAKNCTVKLQESKYYLIDDPNKLKLRPDIVVRTQNKIIVADTKWKFIKEEGDISNSDLYQIFAYASKYNENEKGCEQILLIYPATSENNNIQDFEFNICGKNVILSISFFDLKQTEFINFTNYSIQQLFIE